MQWAETGVAVGGDRRFGESRYETGDAKRRQTETAERVNR